MIIKKQKFDDFVIYRYCFFSGEKICLNSFCNDDVIKWGYTVWGEVDITYANKNFKLTSGQFFNFSPIGDKHMTITAGSKGAIFLSLTKNIESLKQDYVCQIINNFEQIQLSPTNLEAILIPLEPAVFLSNLDRGTIKTLSSDSLTKLNLANSYSVSSNNATCKVLMLYR